MINNFEHWGEKRKQDIRADANIKDKAEELKKMDERTDKYKAKLGFLADLKTRPRRRTSRSSIHIK